jgi:hypothetical protein
VSNPAGRGEAVCHLDFDGCLHHCNVRWSEQRGLFLEAPERYRLFQHVELLEGLLAPHPAVRLVLSTSWAQKLGLKAAAGYLPESLRSRVIGATYELAEPGDHFGHLSRGEQVALDVQRRKPSSWLALDDDMVGWPKWTEPHVVFTNPYEGISPVETQAAIRDKLNALAGGGGQVLAQATADDRRRRQRRLAIHQAAVRVLRESPERAKAVGQTLSRWEVDLKSGNAGRLARWRSVLERKAWDDLLEQSESGESLRKGSPFAFVLDAQERLEIFRRFGRRRD